MELFEICEAKMRMVEIWPEVKTNRPPWTFRIYVFLTVFYLFVPEIIYVATNHRNIENFGLGFSELMVVSNYMYKLVLLMLQKQNWILVLKDIRELFAKCNSDRNGVKY